MALLSLTNAKILVGPADLSAHSNKVTLAAETDELDSTTYGSSGFRSMVGGLKKVDIDVEGFWEASDFSRPDDRLFTDLGVSAVPMTVTPTGGTVADTSYFTRVVRPQYSQGGQVGELVTFQSSARGDGSPLVRGQVADNQVRTATGTTTVLTLTAPAAGTRVYACVHVLAASGTGSPTLTVTLQGDDGAGFPSAATVASGVIDPNVTRVLWLEGAYGVTADSFYRLSYVVSGTNPSFTVFASIGVAG